MSLPTYPVPKLETTLTEIKTILKPIISQIEYEEFVDELNKSVPLLEEGQKRFEVSASHQNNWATECFQKFMLSLRAPLNDSTYVGCLLKTNETTEEDQCEYAAVLTYALIQTFLHHPIKDQNGIKLEQTQLTNLFATTRVPGLEADTLQRHDMSKNVLVLWKESAFVLEAIRNDGIPASIHSIKKALKEIVSKTFLPSSFYKYTGLPRNVWAEIYQKLSKEPSTNAVLTDFGNNIFTLVLEDTETKFKSPIEAFKHFEKSHLRNYDQTLNLVVYKNGVAGIHCDHAVADGSVVLQLAEHLYSTISIFWQQNKLTNEIPASWKLLEECDKFPAIPSTLSKTKLETISYVDFAYLPDIYHLLKENRLFDSWINMALQLALKRVYQEQNFLTVFPTHVRHFYDGRCDPTYLVSNETQTLVKFLLENYELGSSHQKQDQQLFGLQIYANAVVEHKKKIRSTKSGLGVGPHIGILRPMIPNGKCKQILDMFLRPSVVLTGAVDVESVEFGCGKAYAENQLVINYCGNTKNCRFQIRASGHFCEKINAFENALFYALNTTLSYAVMLAIVNQMKAENVLKKFLTKQLNPKKLANTVIAIHGGAGDGEDLPNEIQEVLKFSLRLAILIGLNEAAKTNNSIEIVSKILVALENCFLFNAGKGSVFNATAEHELESSIMDGTTGQAGGVACIKNLKNPILAARKVMEKSDHLLLSGNGAEKFCDDLEQVSNSYFDTEYRRLQQYKTKTQHVQTVGAVAIDSNGRLAAATSTGGVCNKLVGRIGDTAVIGAGTYADKKIAISCTGDGEEFLKQSIASKFSWLYQTVYHENLDKTSRRIIFEDLHQKLAGLIAVDYKGNVVLQTNSNMFCGHFKNNKIYVERCTNESNRTVLTNSHNVESKKKAQTNGVYHEKIRPPKSWKTPELHPNVAITNEWYSGVFQIQNVIFHSTIDYFNKRHQYSYVMTPISTNTISSPMGLGSDSEPVSVELLNQQVYLADSMQFTLEYFLRMAENLPGTYYVSPSFRGEDPDSTHLNQFYHIECELLGDMDKAISIAEGFIIHVLKDILHYAKNFILSTAGNTAHLEQAIRNYEKRGCFPRITLSEALKILNRNDAYELVEENRPELGTKLTRVGERMLISKFGGIVWLTEMDHLSTPFYQAYIEGSNKTKAKAADLLLGMGETLGLGERHETATEVIDALAHHQVPVEEYEWYVNMRRIKPLKTSGWGLGSERFICWLLNHDDVRDIQILPRLKGLKFVP